MIPSSSSRHPISPLGPVSFVNVADVRVIPALPYPLLMALVARASIHSSGAHDVKICTRLRNSADSQCMPGRIARYEFSRSAAGAPCSLASLAPPSSTSSRVEGRGDRIMSTLP